MKKIVINTCFGGFGISQEAYEKLIEWGIPTKKYIEQKRGNDGFYLPEPKNDGEFIFDRLLSKGEGIFNDDEHIKLMGRYWETWLQNKRDHPLLIKVVEELGEKADGWCSKLKVVKIPNDIDWEISEYDGIERVEEKHKSWN